MRDWKLVVSHAAVSGYVEPREPTQWRTWAAGVLVVFFMALAIGGMTLIPLLVR